MENKKMNMEEIGFDPDDTVTCCLCGKQIPWRESNNPWPLVDDEESRCCHDCNDSKVVPARLEMFQAKPGIDWKTFNEDIDNLAGTMVDAFKAAQSSTGSFFGPILKRGWAMMEGEGNNRPELWAGFLMGFMAAERTISPEG